jgi:hypothetical protein
MKNKTRIPRSSPIPKEVSLPAPPLKTDELIDLLERSYDQSVNSVFDLADGILPVLLFLRNTLYEDDPLDELIVHLKDRDVDVGPAVNAVGEILGKCCGPLFEARHEIDKVSTEVHTAMLRYRIIHSKLA